MSFVTVVCGVAAGAATPPPPDPCPHSGPATSAATATAADHRAQCIIPTSLEGRLLFPCAHRQSHVEVAARSGLIVAPIGRVDHHRTDVETVPDVVHAHERREPQTLQGAVPAHPQVVVPQGLVRVLAASLTR